MSPTSSRPPRTVSSSGRSPALPLTRALALVAFPLALAHAFALPLAQTRTAHAAGVEPIALGLLFEPGTTPCFSTAELASKVAERLGQPVSTAAVDTTALSVAVRVRAVASGFAVVIESGARDSAETGQRELQVEGGCDNLAAPLSLVIALLAGASVAPAAPAHPQPVPAPAAAPVVQPVPPPVTQARDDERVPGLAAEKPSEPDRRTGVALSALGGTDFAIAPSASALASVAARLDIERMRTASGTHIAVALVAEFLSSTGNRHEGATFSIGGPGAHALLCAVWRRDWFSVEPSFGLWMRSLAIEGEHDDGSLFDSTRFSVFGWSTGADLRAHVGGPWSVFAGIQGLALFGDTKLMVERAAPNGEPGVQLRNLNADGQPTAPIVGAPLEPEQVQVHETPVFTTVLHAGVTFAP